MTPLKLMTNFTRLCIIAVFIVLVALFGLRGILFSILFGCSAWLMATLALYGPRIMVYDKDLTFRVWLWKHVTFWYDNPDEVP